MRQHLTKSRFRFRKSDGSPDVTALKTYLLAVRHAPDLTDVQKSILAKSQHRMIKSADANEGRLPAINFDGVWVFLDRPKGTREDGVGADGQPWSRTFLCNYGFFPDTIGADNEPVDVFVGDDITSKSAYLVKQVFQDGTFDEFKVLIGFKTPEEALRMYFAHVPAWCFGGVSELPFSFLVQLIGCAPETIPSAMSDANYVPLAKSMIQKIGLTRVESKAPAEPITKAPATRMKTLTKSLCFASIPMSIQKALAGVGGWGANYDGPTIPIDPTSDLASHPALTAPITWDYAYPDQTGGWIGGIEPEDESWIAFIDVTGHALLWTSRDAKGGVMGTPYVFDRPDLAIIDPPAVVEEPIVAAMSTPQPAPIPPQEKLPSGVIVQLPNAPPVIAKDTVSVASVPIQQPEISTRKEDVQRSAFSKAKYDGIDFTPPAKVRANFKRGLELHADGYSGDGLQSDTLAWARRLSRGEKISPAKVTQGNAWFARHESDRKPNWATEKTPGYVAWMNWGGDAGKAWMGKLKRQMDARDKLQKSYDTSPSAWSGRSIDRNEEKRMIFGIVLEPEPFDGTGDAHGHTYSEEEVAQAAYDYLAYFRHLTDNHNHTDACREQEGFGDGVCTCGAYLAPARAVVVESYCTPIEFTMNGVVIKKGTWLLRVHVLDDELWLKVLSGEWNAFSIEGIGDLISLDDEDE